jgi:hypothetical protein
MVEAFEQLARVRRPGAADYDRTDEGNVDRFDTGRLTRRTATPDRRDRSPRLRCIPAAVASVPDAFVVSPRWRSLAPLRHRKRRVLDEIAQSARATEQQSGSPGAAHGRPRARMGLRRNTDLSSCGSRLCRIALERGQRDRPVPDGKRPTPRQHTRRLRPIRPRSRGLASIRRVCPKRSHRCHCLGPLRLADADRTLSMDADSSTGSTTARFEPVPKGAVGGSRSRAPGATGAA